MLKEKKVGKKPIGNWQALFILIISWGAALLFGISTLWASGLISTAINNELVNSSMQPLLIALLIIALVWIFLQSLKVTSLFIKLFQLALAFGFMLIAMLCIISISITDKSNSPSCSSLKSQLEIAQSAVYSINTDLGSGSGFAISNNGYILTNSHVIDGAKEIYTWYYPSENSALTKVPLQIVENQKDIDLAILKLPHPTPDYLSLSNDYEVGEDTYALGFPGNTFDSGYASVSKGIVSRQITSQDSEDIPQGMDFIQTDTAINPGNSGGPLINRCGVIGVTTAISQSDISGELPREEGIGYAVSAKTVKDMLLPSVKSEMQFD